MRDDAHEEERWITVAMQALGRLALRDFVSRKREPLEITLRRVVREELKRAG